MFLPVLFGNPFGVWLVAEPPLLETASAVNNVFIMFVLCPAL